MAKKRTIAIIGSETLLGREVREVLRGAHLDAEISLVASGESPILSQDDAEAVVMADLQAEAVVHASTLILCGPEASSRRALDLLRAAKAKPQIIDASGVLEEKGVTTIAHPAAIALSRFFERLIEIARPIRCVITVFEPASERGQRGIEELQQQTVNLLSFKPLKKEVYDAQLAFNMLAAWGEDAPGTLAAIEERIARGLTYPASLRLIQAPVFHGLSASIWCEFEKQPDLSHLKAPDVDVRVDEPPTNVGAAGEDGITLGAIAPDRANANATWFWLVADNLRLTATKTVEILNG